MENLDVPLSFLPKANSEALLLIDSATNIDVGCSQTFSYHTEFIEKQDVECVDLGNKGSMGYFSRANIAP